MNGAPAPAPLGAVLSVAQRWQPEDTRRCVQMRHLVAGLVGAITMFFLDPDRGAYRRNVMRARLKGTARDAASDLVAPDEASAPKRTARSRSSSISRRSSHQKAMWS